jgi:hypothetical protein
MNAVHFILLSIHNWLDKWNKNVDDGQAKDKMILTTRAKLSLPDDCCMNLTYYESMARTNINQNVSIIVGIFLIINFQFI